MVKVLISKYSFGFTESSTTEYHYKYPLLSLIQHMQLAVIITWCLVEENIRILPGMLMQACDSQHLEC